MDEIDKIYLGTGWGFPPTFDKTSKTVRMVSAEQDICESLHILLTTSIGERVMQPTYGCNLQDLQFEILSPTVISSIKELIRTAIIYHEPRIRLNKLEIEQDLLEPRSGLVKIAIDYTISSTNSRFNIVYPFYIQEGTGNLLAAVPSIES